MRPPTYFGGRNRCYLHDQIEDREAESLFEPSEHLPENYALDRSAQPLENLIKSFRCGGFPRNALRAC